VPAAGEPVEPRDPAARSATPLITDRPQDFLAAAASLPDEPYSAATANRVLLVSPVGFRLDDESRRDNRYMATGSVSEERALAEHRALAEALAGSVEVVGFAGHGSTPDAVFPNNVFATAPGRLVVGRMRSPIRRLEAARSDIRDYLEREMRYRTLDLSQRDDLVAELTGPLVIDHRRGIGYCGLSQRCDRAGAAAMHEAFGLRLSLVFELQSGEYHTNVVLTVLAGRAVLLHPPSFVDPAVPEAICELYADHAVRLSDGEKEAFVANSIALDGDEVWMSARAEAALEPATRQALERWGFRLRSVALDEIEKSGGSLRCCVAELY